MAPRSLGYRQVQQRMRRSLNYGTRRMRTLSLPLSELLVNYFDKYAPYDYLDMDFAASLARESCVDACTFLVAMVYVDRVRSVDKLYFETTDPEEVYLSALVVASKYLHDGGLEEFVYNDEWAASAGRSLKRVNELELQLLDLLSWDIKVDEVEFWRVLNEAERWVARETMLRQGFCTYNEAAVLSVDSKILLEILKSLLSIFATLTILYSAFAVSILLAPRLMVCSLHSSNGSSSRATQSKHSLHQFGLFSSQVFDLGHFWIWFGEPATSTFESSNVHSESFLVKRQAWSFQEKEPLLSQLNRSSALVDTTNFFTCSFA